MDKPIITCCFCGLKFSLKKIESHIKEYCIKTVEVILNENIIMPKSFSELFYKIDKGDFNIVINKKFIEKFNANSTELFSEYMRKVKNVEMTRIHQKRFEQSMINNNNTRITGNSFYNNNNNNTTNNNNTANNFIVFDNTHSKISNSNINGNNSISNVSSNVNTHLISKNSSAIVNDEQKNKNFNNNDISGISNINHDMENKNDNILSTSININIENEGGDNIMDNSINIPNQSNLISNNVISDSFLELKNEENQENINNQLEYENDNQNIENNENLKDSINLNDDNNNKEDQQDKIIEDQGTRLQLENVDLIPSSFEKNSKENNNTMINNTQITNNTAKIGFNNNNSNNKSIATSSSNQTEVQGFNFNQTANQTINLEQINSNKQNIIINNNDKFNNMKNYKDEKTLNFDINLSVNNPENIFNEKFLCLNYLYDRFSGIKINQIKDLEGLLCFICGRKLSIQNYNAHLKTCSAINSYLLQYSDTFPEEYLIEILQVYHGVKKTLNQKVNEKKQGKMMINTSKSPNKITISKQIKNNLNASVYADKSIITINPNNVSRFNNEERVKVENIDLDYLRFLITQFNNYEKERNNLLLQAKEMRRQKAREEIEDEEIAIKYGLKNNISSLQNNNISSIPRNNNISNISNINNESTNIFEYKLNKTLSKNPADEEFLDSHKLNLRKAANLKGLNAEKNKKREDSLQLSQLKSNIANKFELPPSLKLVKCFICWEKSNLTGLEKHFDNCKTQFYRNNPGKHLNTPKSFLILLDLLDERLIEQENYNFSYKNRNDFDDDEQREDNKNKKKLFFDEKMDNALIEYMIEAEIVHRELILVNCEKCWRKFNPDAYKKHLKGCKTFNYENNKIIIPYENEKEEKVSLGDFMANKKELRNYELGKKNKK